jgi:Putative adhesin
LAGKDSFSSRSQFFPDRVKRWNKYFQAAYFLLDSCFHPDIASPQEPPMPIRSHILPALFAAALLTAAAGAQDFERNLPASSATDLYVSTGSGRIHVYPGSDSEVHVKAHLHAGWNQGGDVEERMRRIAANPPVTTSGKEIHIGEVPQEQRDLYKNITIDYEITTPHAVALNLRSGSGDVLVDNVGRSLKGETGSGSIRAHGIAGPSDIHTGSGDIELQQQAAGEVHASTGSGSIRINGLAGALTARTGSGDIEANGNLVGPSKLQTGSGSIHAHIARDAHFNVDASTGSGSIHVAGVSGEHHHLSTAINGGGPSLEAHTGSGDIEIN